MSISLYNNTGHTSGLACNGYTSFHIKSNDNLSPTFLFYNWPSIGMSSRGIISDQCSEKDIMGKFL